MSDSAPRSSQLGATSGGQEHRPRSQASRSNQPPPLASRAVLRPPALLHSRRHRRRSGHHHTRRQPQNDDLAWLTDEPTGDEMEELFFNYLAAGLPESFSVSAVASVWLSPWTLSTAAAVALPRPLLLVSRSGASYLGLFGSWSEEHGYRDGSIVDTLRRLEPQLDPEASPDIAEARGYLAEAIVARWERLSAVPTDGRLYRRRVYEVRVLEGTRQYLESLLDRLAQQTAEVATDH